MCYGFCLSKQTKKSIRFVKLSFADLCFLCIEFSQYRKCTQYVHCEPVVKRAHVIVHCKLYIKCNQILEKKLVLNAMMCIVTFAEHCFLSSLYNVVNLHNCINMLLINIKSLIT